MWKTYGTLSDTDIDCMVIDRAIYSGKNNALDTLRTGQYAYFDIISFIICFSKSVQHRYRGFLFARSWICLFNCCHSALFLLTGSMTVKNHTEVNTCMSCLGIAESHLEHNALLLQQSRYEKRFKCISQK